MRAVYVVLEKELRELIRDWRTLTMMVLVPVVLYPGLFVVAEQLFLFGRRQMSSAPVVVAIEGAAPEALLRSLESDRRLRLLPVTSGGGAMVVSKEADATLTLTEPAPASPGRHAAPAGDGARAPLRAAIVYDATHERSRLAQQILSGKLTAWADSSAAGRLRSLGLSPALLHPVSVESHDVAPRKRMGLFILARLLPFILIMMTVLGTFYAAIDLGAGERERGTLEALMTTPVPAIQIVGGKFIAVTIVGVLAALLNLASMAVTLRSGLFDISHMLGLDVSLPPSAIVVILLTLPPLALFFGALFLGISVQARSFKEAQSALTPVFMLGAIPAILPAVPGIALTPAMAMLPVVGVALLFRELMAGQVGLGLALLAVGANMGYALLSLRFAAARFGREDALFGAGARPVRLGSLLARMRVAPAGVPSPGTVAMLLAAMAAAFFYVGRPLAGALPGFAGPIVTELAVLALPVLALVWLGRFDPRESLNLRRPTARGLLAGALVGLGGGGISWLLITLQLRWLALPEGFVQLASKLAKEGTQAPLALFAALVLAPALCEELVFRGLFLGSTLRKLGLARAALLNAVVFGAFHVSFETGLRFLPTLWLGLLLALLVGRTRSIWTSMLAHACNNGIFVVLALNPGLVRWIAAEGGAAAGLLLPLAAFAAAAGIALFPREPAPLAAGD